MGLPLSEVGGLSQVWRVKCTLLIQNQEFTKVMLITKESLLFLGNCNEWMFKCQNEQCIHIGGSVMGLQTAEIRPMYSNVATTSEVKRDQQHRQWVLKVDDIESICGSTDFMSKSYISETKWFFLDQFSKSVVKSFLHYCFLISIFRLWPNHFTYHDNKCIWLSWVCDCQNDGKDGKDEDTELCKGRPCLISLIL